MCALLCVNRSLKLAPVSVVVPYQYSMIIWVAIFWLRRVRRRAFIGCNDRGGVVIIIGAGLYIFLRERKLGRGGGGGQSAGMIGA